MHRIIVSALKEWSCLQKSVSKVTPKKFYEIDPQDLSYKSFCGCKCCRIVIKYCSLLPQSNIWEQDQESTFTLRGSTLVCSSLALKYQTRVIVNGSVKHSSLLCYGISYGSKKFYSLGLWCMATPINVQPQTIEICGLTFSILMFIHKNLIQIECSWL